MIFQNPDSTLNPSHSIEFALVRPLKRLRGMSRSEARDEVRRLIERVRLGPADQVFAPPFHPYTDALLACGSPMS